MTPKSRSYSRTWSVYLGSPRIGRKRRGYRVQLNASEFYEPRLTQLDLRFTKILQCGLGRARVRAWLDIFNVFNENSTSRIVANYTAPEFAYPRVSQVMVGRLLKFGGQFDW